MNSLSFLSTLVIFASTLKNALSFALLHRTPVAKSSGGASASVRLYPSLPQLSLRSTARHYELPELYPPQNENFFQNAIVQDLAAASNNETALEYLTGIMREIRADYGKEKHIDEHEMSKLFSSMTVHKDGYVNVLQDLSQMDAKSPNILVTRNAVKEELQPLDQAIEKFESSTIYHNILLAILDVEYLIWIYKVVQIWRNIFALKPSRTVVILSWLPIFIYVQNLTARIKILEAQLPYKLFSRLWTWYQSRKSFAERLHNFCSQPKAMVSVENDNFIAQTVNIANDRRAGYGMGNGTVTVYFNDLAAYSNDEKIKEQLQVILAYAREHPDKLRVMHSTCICDLSRPFSILPLNVQERDMAHVTTPGEHTPQYTYQQLTTHWGVGPHLATALMCVYGGQLLKCARAVEALRKGEILSTVDDECFARVQACMVERPSAVGYLDRLARKPYISVTDDPEAIFALQALLIHNIAFFVPKRELHADSAATAAVASTAAADAITDSATDAVSGDVAMAGKQQRNKVEGGADKEDSHQAEGSYDFIYMDKNGELKARRLATEESLSTQPTTTQASAAMPGTPSQEAGAAGAPQKHGGLHHRHGQPPQQQQVIGRMFPINHMMRVAVIAALQQKHMNEGGADWDEVF